MHVSARFRDALVYATVVHGSQVKKATGAPYLAHLMGVASLVLEHGGDEDAAIGALLHDAAEDHGGEERLADIRRNFGPRVARIVEGCTDSMEKKEDRPPWRKRKEAYVRRLVNEREPTLLVSVADKVHNIRSLVLDVRQNGPKAWDDYSGGREGRLWYYHALLRTYTSVGRRRRVSPGARALTRELGERVEELDLVAKPRRRKP